MYKMHESVVKSAAFAVAVLLWSPVSVAAVPCVPANLSSFSQLGQVVEDARADIPGKLLAAWLLRSRDANTCKFVFRIDLLLLDGRVLSMNFDAETLEPVEIDDDRGWVDAGNLGAGGEDWGSFEPDSSSAAAGDEDKDEDKDEDEDNSGSGSTSSGSGSSGSDDEDSDNSGSGSDSDNSGSGSDSDSDNSGSGSDSDNSGSGHG